MFISFIPKTNSINFNYKLGSTFIVQSVLTILSTYGNGILHLFFKFTSTFYS